MKCLNCGKENTSDDLFCVYCGAMLEKEAESTPEKQTREVKSILEEYLPQISAPTAKCSSYLIAPKIDMNNYRQIVEEMLQKVMLTKIAVKTWWPFFEAIQNSICNNGETIQGFYHCDSGKLGHPPGSNFIFSDRAVYIVGPLTNQSSWYIQSSQGDNRRVFDSKCLYNNIDQVSASSAPLLQGGMSGFHKVSCSLVDSSDRFEFLLEKKLFNEEKLAEMIQVLGEGASRPLG